MLVVKASPLALFTSVHYPPSAPLYFFLQRNLTWRKSSSVRICKVRGWAPSRGSVADRSWWRPGPSQTPWTEQEAGSGRSGPSSLCGCGGTFWSGWQSSAARQEPSRSPWKNPWALEGREKDLIIFLSWLHTRQLSNFDWLSNLGRHKHSFNRFFNIITLLTHTVDNSSKRRERTPAICSNNFKAAFADTLSHKNNNNDVTVDVRSCCYFVSISPFAHLLHPNPTPFPYQPCCGISFMRQLVAIIIQTGLHF